MATATWLLTNDDGIDAPGIAALHDSVTAWLRSRQRRIRLIVVAPDRGRSECSHSVITGRPLVVAQLRDGWFAVDGTPADCVRVAMTAICPGIEVVHSGINAGANVGVDILVSGTVAAAREASLWGRAAIAWSHYRRPGVPKTWDHCPAWTAPVLDQFAVRLADPATTPPPLWNVNLPAIDPGGPVPPVVDCPLETQPIVRRLDGEFQPPALGESDVVQTRSDFHGRPRVPGSDVDRCFGGQTTLTNLNTTVWDTPRT